MNFDPEQYGVNLRGPITGQQDSIIGTHATSPSKHQWKHYHQMSQIAGNTHAPFINDTVSPYSILRNSAEEVVDNTI